MSLAMMRSSSLGITQAAMRLSSVLKRPSAPVNAVFRSPVEAYAERLKWLADPAADLRGTLADAAAEDDGVDASEHGDVGADVLAHPVAEHLDRVVRPGMAFRLFREQRRHVAAAARDAEKAGAVVEDVVEFIRG